MILQILNNVQKQNQLHISSNFLNNAQMITVDYETWYF